MKSAEFEQLAFFPGLLPISGPFNPIARLSRILTGVEVVRVGFKNWEQHPVDEGEWFLLAPRIGALYVTAVCKDARWQTGERLPRCTACGRLRFGWGDLTETARNLELSIGHWPQTDLFLLEGGCQGLGLFVTQPGLEKITSAGWHVNLDLYPVNWETS